MLHLSVHTGNMSNGIKLSLAKECFIDQVANICHAIFFIVGGTA